MRWLGFGGERRRDGRRQEIIYPPLQCAGNVVELGIAGLLVWSLGGLLLRGRDTKASPVCFTYLFRGLRGAAADGELAQAPMSRSDWRRRARDLRGA